MAIGFDKSGVLSSNSSAVSTLSGTFTIGAALTNGVIVGMLGVFRTSGTISAQAMTWAGASMTLIPGSTVQDTGSGTISLFGILGPTGATQTLSSTWTGAGQALIGLWSFSGASQSSVATTFINVKTIDQSAGTTSTGTIGIGTANGNATVAGFLAGSNFSVSGSQSPTPDWQSQPAGGAIGQAQHILSGTATPDRYSVKIAANDIISAAGLCIVQAAAAAGNTPYNPYIAQPQLASILAQKRKHTGWNPYYDPRFRPMRKLLVPDKRLFLPKKVIFKRVA